VVGQQNKSDGYFWVPIIGILIGVPSFFKDFLELLSQVWPAAGLIALSVFSLAVWHYWKHFQDHALAAPDTHEYAKFEELKARLAMGGSLSMIYESNLTRFLDSVDRFFGDDNGRANTLFPGAFYYKGNAPFWTAPAYDRCLIFALIYPLFVLLLVWTLSGEAGEGELAIGLGNDVPTLRRAFAMIGVTMSAIGAAVLVRINDDRAPWLPLAVSIGGALIAFVTAGFGAFAIAIATSMTAFGLSAAASTRLLFNDRYQIGVGTFAISFAVAVVFAFAVAVAFSESIEGIGAIVAIFVLILAFVFAGAMQMLSGDAARSGRFGVFLFSLTFVLIVLCYCAALVLGRAPGWGSSGALLLFFGVLTLVNAPFDWATIGITRALLRRGLEMKGWWPLILGAFDFILAAIIIVLLAVVMLLAIQSFEYVSGAPILNVERILDHLADAGQRTAPEYWWIYATLFSTLIPSIINVSIGALSVVRGLTGFHHSVAEAMVPGTPMPSDDAFFNALALASSALLSVVIGLILTFGWMWVMVTYIFPSFGGLIPMLRSVAGVG
jgi:hypothetical protein